MSFARATAFAIALPALLAGCSGLLPRGSGEVVSGFKSFDEARAALESVEPYRTTTAELATIGFDIAQSSNVRQIPYPEVMFRLAPNQNVPLELLDAGIRDCITAQQACKAYEFRLERQSRRREGPFLPDFFNFRRFTRTTGWRFEGLIVVRDGVVLFRNYGGEPNIERNERQNNPLGPLQPSGEAAGAFLLR
jgi:hypothetical protein